MNVKSKLFKIFLVIISFIVLVNIVGHTVSIVTDASLILRIEPTNEVFIFAHGYQARTYNKTIYQSFDALCFKFLPEHIGYFLWNYLDSAIPRGKMHKTKIDGKYIPTYLLLDNLREEGYKRIWISMCQQENSDYVVEHENGTKIEWGTDVSRVKVSGNICPIYWGLGIYRFII